ncbi:hypothetical protein HDU86_007137 [Geranomyces michiganensis]|nr:hypothetical protein HDU86_007137 [Geranomyces michiganensis]
MATADQVSLRSRSGVAPRGGTDLSGFLDRLRATVVSAPASALGPTPTRPGDVLKMRINRETARLSAQQSQLRELRRERDDLERRQAEDKRVIYDLTAQAAAASLRAYETAEELTQQAARIQQLRITTAEERKTMQAAVRSLRTWIDEKMGDISDPGRAEAVKNILDQVDSARIRIFAEDSSRCGDYAAHEHRNGESSGDPIADFGKQNEEWLFELTRSPSADIRFV